MAWEPLASTGLMLTILEFWLAVQTAQTFISHVALQVYRNPVSMFTTYLLPTEGLFVPSRLRAGDGARQWSRVFFGAQQPFPLPILDASSSFKFARAVAVLEQLQKQRETREHKDKDREQGWRRSVLDPRETTPFPSALVAHDCWQSHQPCNSNSKQ